jgi:copper(I)-binding protein
MSAESMSATLPSRVRAGRCARTAAMLTLVIAADAHALFILNQPWVKPGARNSEGYMVLTSTEGAMLVGVTSPLAKQVSLRGARGRVLAALSLPAGVAIALRPGADRIVLIGLTRALKPGDRVALTLQVEMANGDRAEIAVNAEVRTRSPYDAERGAHRH